MEIMIDATYPAGAHDLLHGGIAEFAILRIDFSSVVASVLGQQVDGIIEVT